MMGNQKIDIYRASYVIAKLTLFSLPPLSLLFFFHVCENVSVFVSVCACMLRPEKDIRCPVLPHSATFH